MKKIVFYLSDFQSGGTEWFALRLAESLKARGYEPAFLVSRDDGPLGRRIKEAFPVEVLGGTGYALLRLLPTLPRFMRYLKKEKPRCLISGLPLLNIVAWLALKGAQSSCKLIAVEHMRLVPHKTGWMAPLKFFIRRALTHRVRHHAHAFVCVSTTVLKDIMGDNSPPENTHIIPNPVIPDSFRALLLAGVHHPWLSKKDTPVVLAVGRLLPVKDFATLLTAFHSIAHQTNARLVILGEGEERGNLQALIKTLHLDERVSLPGAVDNVFPALAAADLFVLSSREEAFGNVLVEALACGAPVVSTDCGGPREILQGGRFGTLVPPHAPEALGAAILTALASPHNKAEIMAHGTSFTSEKAAQAYAALIASS